MLPSFPSIESLHAAYAAGLDPKEMMATLHARIAAAGDPGIFITLVPENEALAAAGTLGRFDPVAKPLWGIPFAVKDNIDVAGLPTTAACPAFAYMPTVSAQAVQRLIEAGAIVIGKTNLDQFATGLVGTRTPYPMPRNPFDANIIPGGSSSGSAVAVARGLVTFALGTDTAGSGRVPAGLNNIVGLKPSLGSISSRGLVPACRTLDTMSIFAGSVADADTVFRLIARYDAADPWSRPQPIAAMPTGLPPGLVVGVPDAASCRFSGDALSATAFDAALVDLAGLPDGVKTQPVDFAPLFEVAQLLYGGPWVAERYQAIRAMIEARPEALHPVTRQIIASAVTLSAADAFAGLYRLAELRRAADSVWKGIDVLLVPTYPRPFSLADVATDPISPNSELGTYTNFVNLLDLCALAVPSRFRADGSPSGVTLIAPRGQDGLLAALGARLHSAAGVSIGATDAKVSAPAAGSARAASGEIELVVVGAHLSGMALNHELTSRGARFLRALQTTPDYRLYALAGGPPYRPGLLRVPAGAGQSIAVEVWGVPAAELGGFIAGIPAPLAIGTLKLADGTTPKGFLVEPEGLAGAEDISSHGGWRAYMSVKAG